MKPILQFYYWYLRTLPSRLSVPKIKIKGLIETIDEIIDHKKSISRFGDGEIRMMINKGKIIFQSENNLLTERLQEVLHSDLDNLIVALPQPINSINNIKLSSKYFWVGFLNLYGKAFSKFINPKRVYGNSFISRFYMIFENKSIAPKAVTKLKQIWEKNEILIIEGEFSRIGVGNDLFDNATSVKRIICPSENAFSKYNEILETAQKHAENKVILIALGPTATILSYDLAKHGFWALDVGHIDVEYMWMLQKAAVKIPLKGRYVSEARDVKDFELPQEYSASYENSIIEKIEL